MRAAGFVVVCLIAIAFTPLAGAEEPRGAVVPTETCIDYFFVPITLAPRDGAPEDAEARTLRLLYDTGASTTYIDPDALERVSGRRIESGDRVTIRNVEAGPVTWTRLPARIGELDHLGHALNRAFDGILAYGAFEDVLVTLDYPNREMRVREGSLPAPDGREVFRYRGKNRPFLRIDAGGRRRNVLIDSGSSGVLSLKETRGMRWAAEPLPISASMRFDRLEMREMGRLDDEVTIGPVTFDDPVTSLTDGTQLIGARLLRTMSLTFDQKNRRVRMVSTTPGPIRLEPVRDIGAAFFPRPHGLEVVGLLEDGPADRAGLTVGDVVLTLDGAPMADLGCLRERMRDPVADSWTLGVVRGDESMEFDVAIETLVP